jgi:hypothetical protein
MQPQYLNHRDAEPFIAWPLGGLGKLVQPFRPNQIALGAEHVVGGDAE